MNKIIYICFQQNGPFLQQGRTNYLALINFFRNFTGDDALTISQKKNSKPKIISQNPLFFNISHKRNYFLMAFSSHFPIGVDLEITGAKNTTALLNLAKRFFHKEEYELIKKDKDIQKKFYDLWTMKEAIYKLPETSISKKFFNTLKQNTNIWQKDLFVKKLSLGKGFFAHLVGNKNATPRNKIITRYL